MSGAVTDRPALHDALEFARKTGHTYSQPDLIIAATALHYGLTVVTRDTAEFEQARAPVFNPWRQTDG